MNKNLFLAPVCLAVVTASCTQELPVGTERAANTVISASALPAQENSSTRTAVDENRPESGEIGINWIASDMIGVFGNGSSSNVPFENTSKTEGHTASFAGNLAPSESPRYAYYPYSPDAGNDPTKLKGTLAATQKYNTSTRTLDNDWKAAEAPGNATEMTFNHLFPFLHFVVNAGGTEVKGETLRSITLTIPDKQLNGDFTHNLTTGETRFTPGGSDAVVMEWENAPLLSENTFDGFMTCAPVTGINGKILEIKVTTNKHQAVFNVECAADELKKGYYYTLPLTLEKFKDTWTLTEVREDAPWVSGRESRLACANTLFSLPNTPYMHKIRVDGDVKTVEAYNLPEGLTWNDKRKLVQGQIAAEGDYTYSVEVKKSDGTVFREGIKLFVSSKLVQPTPMMGWQSWNVLESNIGHDTLLVQAQKMVDLGLLGAGYNYLGVDDFWSKDYKARDSGTNYPTVNSTKFPNGMKAFTDAVHALGLKVGIYSDAGNVTCGKNNTGSYGYEDVDAKAFTEWGFDMLKEDWYTTAQLTNGTVVGNAVLGDSWGFTQTDKDHPWQEQNSAFTLYGRMGAAIYGISEPIPAVRRKGNEMLLYMCEWGIHEPWKWAAEVGASCWRVTYDGRDAWNGQKNTGKTTNIEGDKGGIGLRNTIDLMRHLWPYNGVNRFNDADMICVGIRGTGKPSNGQVATTGGLNAVENETAFVMWCMWSSPILLGMDLTESINEHDMALLLNEELIAINQDPMGQAAEFIKAVGDDPEDKNVDYYMKDLANGDVAIAVVNLSDEQKNYSIDLADYSALDAAYTYSVRDLLKKADAGTFSATLPLTGPLPAHGCVAFRLKKN